MTDESNKPGSGKTRRTAGGSLMGGTGFAPVIALYATPYEERSRMVAFGFRGS